jgi:hypothetical protein
MKAERDSLRAGAVKTPCVRDLQAQANQAAVALATAMRMQ